MSNLVYWIYFCCLLLFSMSFCLYSVSPFQLFCFSTIFQPFVQALKNITAVWSEVNSTQVKHLSSFSFSLSFTFCPQCPLDLSASEMKGEQEKVSFKSNEHF